MVTRTRALFIMAAVALITGGVYWYYTKTSSPILPYDAARDRAFIIDLCKKNNYMLFADPHFDVEMMLDYKVPNPKDMSNAGKLQLYTYVVDSKPAGFTAVYQDPLKVGRILFLCLDDGYRGKGYARQLMKFDIQLLKSQGMLAIRMFTRVDNTKARKLYESLGFKEIWTDGTFLIYEIIP